MPTIVATLRVKPDKVEEARKLLQELAAVVKREEPGTLAYVFHQRKDDPACFVAYEKYVSEEAFKTHQTNLAKHGAKLIGVIAGRPEIAMLEEI